MADALSSCRKQRGRRSKVVLPGKGLGSLASSVAIPCAPSVFAASLRSVAGETWTLTLAGETLEVVVGGTVNGVVVGTLAEIAAALAWLIAEDGDLDDGWSAYNVTAYRHPLSATVPLVGHWLDMPRVPLPGDLFTTRMHWGAIAASQRMVVSPGREAEGVMQMPTGQSGHPLSPFYGNSHAAWVAGEKAPFLPGAAVYELTLLP